MSDYIAVIDIGKTNKKVVIYNRKLELVDSVKKNFEEIHRDGIHYEDVAGQTTWLKGEIKAMAAKYEIGALSVTTHGATVVCIDKDGNVAVPTVAYTTEADAEFSNSFFDRFGSREALQQTTATAEIGSMINPGKLISFMQQTFPTEFESVAHILFYPQYFGYLFTGKVGAEPTYLGCHSYLFDPHTREYSDVAKGLGIAGKLPEKIGMSWDVLGTVSPEASAETGLSESCIVTMGIHDSNASLLPYLVQQHSDFALNSTGTWCVAMHPQKEICFKDEELGKTVFFNLDAFFNPVKTSIFMGGLEFETYIKILQTIAGSEVWPGDLAEDTRKEIAACNRFILPSVARGVGLFPASKPCVVEGDARFPLEGIEDGSQVPDFFKDFNAAAAVLNLALAYQTWTALQYVGFSGKGTLYVEGGSRGDKNYMGLLAALYPEATIASTHLEEATSFGAAILAEAALQEGDPMVTKALFSIEERPTEKMDYAGLDRYFKAYSALL